MDENIHKAIASLPPAEQQLLLELVGAPTNASEAAIIETLTSVAITTQTPGIHSLETPLGRITLHVGREGQLLNARELDPHRPLRAGLVTGLPPEERPTAFALLVTLANTHHGALDATGKRDLVSLISSALGDALTRR